MAKIAFFIERLPPDGDPISDFAYDLIRSLADQSHEIRIYSTYVEGAPLPPSHPRIAILRPFKTWSWLEIPRVLPLLLEFRPDVLHLVQPGPETRRAMSILPALARLLGKPPIVASLYDVMDRELGAHRWLLAASDAITVSSDPQKDLLEKYLASFSKPARRRVHTLPISIGARHIRSVSSNSALQTLDAGAALSEAVGVFLSAAIDADMIFVPGDISEHGDAEALFETLAGALAEHANALVLFGGGWGRIPHRRRHRLMRVLDAAGVGARVLLTGPIDADTERICLARARVVFLASLARESLGLARILRQALDASAPLIMSRSQADTDALNWRHDENSLLVEAEPGLRALSWITALDRALKSPHLVEHIRAGLPEFTRAEAVDHPGNVVSRVYAQILSNRAAP